MSNHVPSEVAERSYGIIPVYEHDGTYRFLLLHHISGGHWAFPKGHRNEGEDTLDTALRELKEETGISLERTDVVSVRTFVEQYPVSWQGNTHLKEATYWIGRIQDPAVNIQVHEIRDYRWVTAKEAQALITYPQSRNLLAEVEGYLATQEELS